MNRKKHPLYGSWINMRTRCNNPNYRAYHRYGGRGIAVCLEWEDFWKFVEDMGERPEGCSLDRINTDGNYEKSNCRWATQQQQVQNTGALGVHWCRSKRKYIAQIQKNKCKIYLGAFSSEEDARQAYLNAKQKYHLTDTSAGDMVNVDT